MSRLKPRQKPIHALEQLRVSDTLMVRLRMANDSQYQAVIENDNENRSQAAGTEKPQPGETGATVLYQAGACSSVSRLNSTISPLTLIWHTLRQSKLRQPFAISIQRMMF